ncbi:ATP-binding cassette domain-containing protein [Microbacteriaceae bacterium VKM Ac-2855]|nr:ATP-binding cassette domain-containing protein [Microbacteriaceae bacterium VKM Ac-2855]
MPSALSISGVTKIYSVGHQKHAALDDVSLELSPTGRVGIVGESGSGKSTLAKLLVGFERPTSGSARYGGTEVSSLLARAADMRAFRRSVQFVAQDTTSSFNPRYSLRESVVRPARQLLGMSRAEANQRADETFERLELPIGLADRKPSAVSGGQRQRFSIARALVVRPAVLICDEAVSALDVSVQGTVLNHLKDYSIEEGCGIVFVSHGLPATAFLCDELVVMSAGRIVEQGPTAQLIAHAEHPYTRSLLDAYRYTAGEGALAS